MTLGNWNGVNNKGKPKTLYPNWQSLFDLYSKAYEIYMLLCCRSCCCKNAEDWKSMVYVVALFISFYAEDNCLTATQLLAELMTPPQLAAPLCYYRFYQLSTLDSMHNNKIYVPYGLTLLNEDTFLIPSIQHNFRKLTMEYVLFSLMHLNVFLKKSKWH